jgi:3-oxoacyl-[acyl-carrier protein] reductase
MEGYTLDGKTALVTGVEHQVPRASAAALAEAGADVAVVAGHAGPVYLAYAEEAAAVVQQHGRQSRPYAIEVVSMSAVRTAVDELVQRWGHLDVLVNGLDAPCAGAFVESTESDWQHVFEHMLYGTLHCVQAAGWHMVQQRQGRVITYLSVLAERGVAHCAAYSAVQAALLQLTRSLAVEWGTRGITVNAVGSGWLQDSPLLPAADDERQRLLRYIPDHRLGQPDDLATLTVYLASDWGGNITGQAMYIEGGVMSHP